ncbi:MAG: dTMP kinase [Anaplasma sp.]
MFITFEGVDGCGKTTQAALLAKYLSDLYGEGKVILTREPGGTSFNELVRNTLLGLEGYKLDKVTELLLFLAMRRESFVKVVSPGLLEGKTVISDRYVDSTLAYQGYGCGIDENLVVQLNALVVDVMPNITFILDIGTEKALARTRLRGCESRGVEFYDRVRDGFRTIAKRDAHRCHLVDCVDGDVYSVHRMVVELFHRVSGTVKKAPTAGGST